MKKTSLFASVIVLILVSVAGISPARAASGGGIDRVGSNCSGYTFGFKSTLFLGSGESLKVTITNANTGESLGSSTVTFPAIKGFFGNLTKTVPNGTPLRFTFDITGFPQEYADTTCYSGPGLGSVSDDGRVNGQPGDRFAVYCSATSMTVYGVAPDSSGFLVANISFADVVKAGAAGFNASKDGLGTLSVSVDGGNTFYMAWNGQITSKGGNFYADGSVKNGFAKQFSCAFRR